MMFRKTRFGWRIDAIAYVALLIPVVLLVAFAPAQAQTSNDPDDWFGASVIVGGSNAAGGWEHATAANSHGGEGWAASGSANIETGELKAVAGTGSRGPNNCHPWFCAYRASAVASSWDILHINNVTDQVIEIPYTFTASGTVSEGDWGWARGYARYAFGGDVHQWFNAPQIDITHGPYSVSGTLHVNPGTTLTRYWFALIGAEAGNGGTADFGHTMRFSWEVPEGITYTSASGRFMAGVAAVPEPASWAMMILGFGLVGSAVRRPRRPSRVLA